MGAYAVTLQTQTHTNTCTRVNMRALYRRPPGARLWYHAISHSHMHRPCTNLAKSTTQCLNVKCYSFRSLCLVLLAHLSHSLRYCFVTYVFQPCPNNFTISNSTPHVSAHVLQAGQHMHSRTWSACIGACGFLRFSTIATWCIAKTQKWRTTFKTLK